MKILITSGGTKIPIDSVRSITNMSHGTFGSQIAESFLQNMPGGSILNFLFARGSKVPTSGENPLEEKNSAILFRQYETFWDYDNALQEILDTEPDIIILAAAVSDYAVVDPVEGKARSKEDMTIVLKPLPKLISGVREKCPNATICGFKLLVNSKESELLAAARNSIRTNNVDLVVANDLSTIKNEDHSLHIVESNWSGQFFRSENNLATVVRDCCMYHYYRRTTSQPKEKRAPVQSDIAPNGLPRPSGTVAWNEHQKAWDAYAKKYGKVQSAERIAERGGFGWNELFELLGHEPKTWKQRG
jgi:phosphopantothenate-cysteine ligase